ncbi:MAG: radical SAM protein [Candidatus Freyarchaeota archaeon]
MKKNFTEILEKALEKPITYTEAKLLLNIKNPEPLLETARAVTDSIAGRCLKVYTPSPLFPPISITGTKCGLNCAHCNRHYLSHMIPAVTPRSLYETCTRLDMEGAVGCLISGGSSREGYVPLAPFIDAIRRVKEETTLLVNVHTGLIGEELARRLAWARIDVASLDIVGSRKVIRNIYGLNKDVEDYRKAAFNHVKAGIRHVVPHICIGLNYGRTEGEVEALKIVKELNPEVLVFIVFTPTKGTRMENAPPPSPLEAAKVMAVARLMLRSTSIALGCMRPSGKVREEIDLLSLNIVDRIVLPTRKALREAEELGLKVKRLNACCAIPTEYDRVIEEKQRGTD